MATAVGAADKFSFGGTSSGTGTARVGTSAAQITSTSTPAKRVLVKAANANTGLIYVGKDTVTNTTGSNNLTTGYQLAADQEVLVICPDGDLSNVYIIASVADQDVTFMWDS